MNGWLTCDFTSFLTVFYSCQDGGWVKMKCHVQEKPENWGSGIRRISNLKDLHLGGSSNPGPLDQQASV